MNNSPEISQIQMAGRQAHNFLKTPSSLIEYTFFIFLCYSMLGTAYGLAIRMVGPLLLAGLAVLCVMHFGSYSIGAFRPIKFALACAISWLLIQGIIYEESFGDGLMRSFITWTFSLIIVQSLFFRKGFLHRFAILAFLIGLATLPFMTATRISEEMIRVGGGAGVALRHPNVFGMWFGFCSVYFIVSGLEAKNYIHRTAAWSVAIFCLFLMALTVSRGSLLGVAIATVIAFERVLKRSFLPILGFLTLGWLVFVSGLFDDLIGYYLQRGTEETGRSHLWAWAFSGFLESWWLGVGLSDSLIRAC